MEEEAIITAVQAGPKRTIRESLDIDLAWAPAR